MIYPIWILWCHFVTVIVQKFDQYNKSIKFDLLCFNLGINQNATMKIMEIKLIWDLNVGFKYQEIVVLIYMHSCIDVWKRIVNCRSINVVAKSTVGCTLPIMIPTFLHVCLSLNLSWFSNAYPFHLPLFPKLKDFIVR